MDSGVFFCPHDYRPRIHKQRAYDLRVDGKRKDVLYVSFQWQAIMSAIRNLSERIFFKRLNL
ncbi:MAG: hypothetical protein ABI209_09830 [Edaphobacter sp.]